MFLHPGVSTLLATTLLLPCSSSSPEQDEDSAWGCWSRRRRHFFIVTSAGKPVYSRHGDEAALAGEGVLSAAAAAVSTLPARPRKGWAWRELL